jgi:hypothetical protein
MFKLRFFAGLILTIGITSCATGEKISAKTAYVWQNVTAKAEFPESYGYPVFVLEDKTFLAINNGGWISKDGKHWTKTALAESDLNAGYQKYVKFGDAVYRLGSTSGNYLDFTVSTKISRTRDGQKWETVAENSNLPQRIFYGAVAFKDKIWLVGGYDGKRYYNDVWNSLDGVAWTRVAGKSEWSERTAGVIVFKDRLWLIGGGVIDGEKNSNPNSGNEIWSAADGVNWTKADVRGIDKLGGSAVVFDDRLWLVGANRTDGNFGNAVLTSDDGANWRALSAPWTPRGAVVVWVYGDRLFMTGGKYSHQEPNGEIKFVYSNDVWAMTKAIKN